MPSQYQQPRQQPWKKYKDNPMEKKKQIIDTGIVKPELPAIDLETIKKGEWIEFRVEKVLWSKSVKTRPAFAMWTEGWKTDKDQVITFFGKKAPGIVLLSNRPIVRARFVGIDTYGGKLKIKVSSPRWINQPFIPKPKRNIPKHYKNYA